MSLKDVLMRVNCMKLRSHRAGVNTMYMTMASVSIIVAMKGSRTMVRQLTRSLLFLTALVCLVWPSPDEPIITAD